MYVVLFFFHPLLCLFQVRKLIVNLQTASRGLNVSVEEPGFSQPLPPCSFQRFLRARPIPGVVIEDHQSAFTNRWFGASLKHTIITHCHMSLKELHLYFKCISCSVCRFYESMYDNAEYLNVSYPTNMTPEEQLEFVTETAKVLMLFSNIHRIYVILN